ncbi:hypothetical protein DICSQDRAFT_170056 [Dichomitus squalens LYAD-421 SS1]|uniref:DUF6533 domain-containing protein n=1 Tax=Dichomitus squalens (strain LYAD-421) TaxID=732165 RepID=R7T104_DICSQ|nr:uncharacterized protein DICSQDRAFT_170056 [Dichomitus squalens LYAD-421 SS1]EJF61640.1 hypothetical protein DICSQDRAFT_170056 [Dichomitus squalens LYAD-421 SS1]
MNSPSDAVVPAGNYDAYYASMLPAMYCRVAIASLVLYDWMITLPREVQLFWTGKSSILSVCLFILNRYLTVIWWILDMIKTAPLFDKKSVCHRMALASLIVYSFVLIPTALFSSLRAYALSRQWKLALAIFVLAIVPVATHVVYPSLLTMFPYGPFGIVDPKLGCLCTGTLPSALDHGRVSAILVDAVLVAITGELLPVSAQSVRDLLKLWNSTGLMGVMLRDGMRYFVVLLLINTLHLTFTELSIVTASGSTSVISLFTTAISSILVSHFLLDLQEAYQRKVVCLASNDPLRSSHGVNLSSIACEPVLGSLGATIDPADWEFPELYAGGDNPLAEDPLPTEGSHPQCSLVEDRVSVAAGGGIAISGEHVGRAVQI